MADTENLGQATSWHIRSVPEAVRQAFVDKAHSERVSVGELLTRLVTGGDAVDEPRRVDMVRRVDVSPHAVDADRLISLLQAAELLTKTELPRGAKGAVRAIIANEIRTMRRQQRGVRQLALPAP